MIRRSILLAACLLVTWAYLEHAARAEPTLERQSLAGLPLSIGEWQGRLEPDLSPAILAVLRVDDYAVRSYRSPTLGLVGFYVGYYGSQRQDASIHSPLNCLPGAGWVPVEQGRMTLHVAGNAPGATRAIQVNRVVIQ